MMRLMAVSRTLFLMQAARDEITVHAQAPSWSTPKLHKSRDDPELNLTPVETSIQKTKCPTSSYLRGQNLSCIASPVAFTPRLEHRIRNASEADTCFVFDYTTPTENVARTFRTGLQGNLAGRHDGRANASMTSRYR
ncbi:hypothetical protein BKA59DRAFT_474875 [Fusarium tricinctum]|uniref:Uncharacterized protein n=1 Tax=Fusarium tricinctum TaxID=61284 RepID=A0A8K0RYT2_9HYPO|nr:hypothetical protein BKA59DRAFT_474875 [Fusarium tricinctum]